MNKYDGLSSYLARSNEPVVDMKFSEIESIINDDLPSSARKHRAWWSNNPSNSVITHAWLDAGFQTEKVDMSEQRLRFRRVMRQVAPKKHVSSASQPEIVGTEVTIDLSELSDKSRKWLEGEALAQSDLAKVILKAVERHANRMQRLAVLAKYEDASIGAGSDSLVLLKEGRDER
jgi:hypothetical protein